ncbi:putative RNA-directed DNA polymerase from transposon BS [Trichonephila clavipes]|nr:putative RNA-directed DNA polymerase from transposon BS [Trichonephila clavipes]
MKNKLCGDHSVSCSGRDDVAMVYASKIVVNYGFLNCIDKPSKTISGFAKVRTELLQLPFSDIEPHSLKSCLSPPKGIPKELLCFDLSTPVIKGNFIPDHIRLLALEIIDEIPRYAIKIFTDNRRLSGRAEAGRRLLIAPSARLSKPLQITSWTAWDFRGRIFFRLSSCLVKKQTNPIISYNDHVSVDAREAAEVLAQHYANESLLAFSSYDKHFARVTRNQIKSCRDRSADNPLFIVDFLLPELFYALQNLDTIKSPGSDSIPGHFLSHLGILGRGRLLYIRNLSWKTGKLPRQWK